MRKSVKLLIVGVALLLGLAVATQGSFFAHQPTNAELLAPHSLGGVD